MSRRIYHKVIMSAAETVSGEESTLDLIATEEILLLKFKDDEGAVCILAAWDPVLENVAIETAVQYGCFSMEEFEELVMASGIEIRGA